MHTFRRILTYFFVTLGVIFFILICAGLIFWMRISQVTAPTDASDTNTAQEEAPQQIDANPYLNETQEKTLKAVGVDPATLPKEITPEMNVCFKETLGAERYDMLASGQEQPSAADFFKARSCL